MRYPQQILDSLIKKHKKSPYFIGAFHIALIYKATKSSRFRLIAAALIIAIKLTKLVIIVLLV
jgi:hypothetical protein